MNDLKKKAFLGVIWGSGNYVFQQIILLVVKLVLVRLLIPDEFGIAAMAWIIISSLSIINAFGTDTAFVRDNKSDQIKAKNTLFYLDSIALLLIAVIGFFSAPLVAGFFGKKISNPETIISLMWMMRLLALTQLLYIITIVPSCILSKKLRFKEGVIANIIGTIAYGLLTTVFAFLGFGAWAIIIGQIASIVATNITIFAYSPFIPSLIFDKKIAIKYLNFGKNAFFNSIMSVIITNGDDTLVGRIIGSAALGFYSLGQHFASLVVALISGMINGVMFPVLSKLQDDRKTFTKAFFKAFRLTKMFAIPSIGGAVILAKEIVVLIFGENWLPIIPIFYLLSISALLNNLVGQAEDVLNSLNKPHILRNNKLIQFGFYVILIYPFIKLWGLNGLCLVFIIFSLVSVFHLFPILAKEIPGFYPFILKILSKILLCTLFMMGVVYYAKGFLPVNFISLLVLVILGVIAYFIPMWFLDKELKWDLQEGWGVIKEKFAFMQKE